MNPLVRRLAKSLGRIVMTPTTVFVLPPLVALWAGPITPPDEFASLTDIDGPTEPASTNDSADSADNTYEPTHAAPPSPRWATLLRGEPNSFVTRASRFSRPFSARGRSAFEPGSGG